MATIHFDEDEQKTIMKVINHIGVELYDRPYGITEFQDAHDIILDAGLEGMVAEFGADDTAVGDDLMDYLARTHHIHPDRYSTLNQTVNVPQQSKSNNQVLNNPVAVVAALASVGGRNDKEAIVQSVWDAENTQFFEGVRLAYDNMITFGVKQVPEAKPVDNNDLFGDLFTTGDPFEWDDFRDLLSKLQNRELTGHDARDAINAAMSRCDTDLWNGWYRLILTKDLRCGVTDTIVNKILKANGKDAKPYMTPKFECQLAQSGDKHPNKICGVKYLDVKLDGVRLLAFLNKEEGTVRLFTRNGKENFNFPTIVESLKTLLPEIPSSIVLDGEIVSKNFQDLMKKFQRKDSTKVDTSDAKFALFDIIPMADFIRKRCDIPLKLRNGLLIEMADLIERRTKQSVYVIPKILVDLDTDDGRKIYNKFNRDAIDAGYEGIMIKDPDAPYECRRSFAWLKTKPTITVDLKVVDMEIGTGKYANTLGALVCHGFDDGLEIRVNVGSGLTDEQRDEFWKNKDELIGEIVEIKADAITKDQSSPYYSLRFPRFLRFRTLGNGDGKV